MATYWDVAAPPPTDSPHFETVMDALKLFYPDYFDPESPEYVDPAIMVQLYLLSEDARPWCLAEPLASHAQAMFLAYLIDTRQEVSSGQESIAVAGPVLSEKEGDISITYADLTKTGTAVTSRPSSDPWDSWNRLYRRCARGAVLTRYGDPCRQSSIRTMGSTELSLTSKLSAIGVWRSVY